MAVNNYKGNLLTEEYGSIKIVTCSLLNKGLYDGVRISLATCTGGPKCIVNELDIKHTNSMAVNNYKGNLLTEEYGCDVLLFMIFAPNSL